MLFFLVLLCVRVLLTRPHHSYIFLFRYLLEAEEEEVVQIPMVSMPTTQMLQVTHSFPL